MNRFVLAAILLLAMTTSFAAERWPRFRGPDGAGQSETDAIPATWTESDYKWRVPLKGIGHSSPVIWDGSVYVTSAMPDDGTRFVSCLSAANGELLWEKELKSTTLEIGNSTSFDTASPAVDEKRLYAAWVDEGGLWTVALDRLTGEEIWRRNLGTWEAEHGYGASPITFEDLLVISDDQKGPSSLVALDCRTGETRWKVNRNQVKAAYSTPIIVRSGAGDSELITSSTANGVSSLDPRTGRLNWELTDVFGDLRVVGSPVGAGGLIFAQSGVGSGGKMLVAIRPADSRNGTPAAVAYEVSGSLPYVPTPVDHGGLLFFISDNGVASCIDIATGERRWRERIGGSFFGSPIRVGERIYIISRTGEMVVFRAASTFELLGRIDLGEPSHSTPAVADDVLFIRTFSHLMAIGDREE